MKAVKAMGHRAGARGAPLALAASLCGAGDRHHSPGVPGSCDRTQVRRLVSPPGKIRRLLYSEWPAPALREGHARVTPVHAPETGRILAIPEVGGFIIGTNVAPPEPRTDVELCHSQIFSMRFVRGVFLWRRPRRFRRGNLTITLLGSRRALRIIASGRLRLGVLDWKSRWSCGRALIDRVSEIHGSR
jgi:hypothetical protein